MAESANPVAPTTADIRSEIERARAEMTRTIDAIQARLSPARLLEQAKESVRGIPGMQTVRDNPRTAALTGLTTAASLVAMLMRQRTRGQRALPFGTGVALRLARHKWMLAAAGAGTAYFLMKKVRP